MTKSSPQTEFNQNTPFPSLKTTIIPVAGMGTRMAPLTNAIPKNLLNIGDRPLIQYAVEEAIEAGSEDIIIICNPDDEALYWKHFYPEKMIMELERKGKTDLLEKIKSVTDLGEKLTFLPQHQARGLGNAVYMAHKHINNEPFGVILPDDFIHTPNDPGCLHQMAQSASSPDDMMIAAMYVPDDQVRKYGVFDVAKSSATDDQIITATGMVEKPTGHVPSNYAAIGRYILPHTVMDILAEGRTGAGGEIQLTDALDELNAQDKHTLKAFRFKGTRYDCGTPEGYFEAGNAIYQAYRREKELERKAKAENKNTNRHPQF